MVTFPSQTGQYSQNTNATKKWTQAVRRVLAGSRDTLGGDLLVNHYDAQMCERGNERVKHTGKQANHTNGQKTQELKEGGPGRRVHKERFMLHINISHDVLSSSKRRIPFREHFRRLSFSTLSWLFPPISMLLFAV
jgi:hypothetical protein